MLMLRGLVGLTTSRALPDVAAQFHVGNIGAAAAAPRASSARGCRSAAAGQTTSGNSGFDTPLDEGEPGNVERSRAAQ